MFITYFYIPLNLRILYLTTEKWIMTVSFLDDDLFHDFVQDPYVQQKFVDVALKGSQKRNCQAEQDQFAIEENDKQL